MRSMYGRIHIRTVRSVRFFFLFFMWSCASTQAEVTLHYLTTTTGQTHGGFLFFLAQKARYRLGPLSFLLFFLRDSGKFKESESKLFSCFLFSVRALLLLHCPCLANVKTQRGKTLTRERFNRHVAPQIIQRFQEKSKEILSFSAPPSPINRRVMKAGQQLLSGKRNVEVHI